jgi:asparagine synthase (glutamine-hydrolysing)
MRKLVARGVKGLSPQAWNKVIHAVRPVTPKFARGMLSGDNLHKGAGILASRSLDEVYLGFSSHWTDPAALAIGATEPPTLVAGNQPRLDGLNGIERMMALDLLTYMPDDILTKVDRAAMGVSLETRVPFLDHRVVEFAWRLPLDHKLREGEGKWPLRQVLYRHVPKNLVDRPKAGFGMPLGAWLNGPLRDWAENLLDESRLRQEGYFRPEPIRRLWKAHREGRVSMPFHLWDVLMFQAWLEAQESGTHDLTDSGGTSVTGPSDLAA